METTPAVVATIEDAMSTGISNIGTSVTDIIIKVLPSALVVLGTFVAIKTGIWIFHKVTGK